VYVDVGQALTIYNPTHYTNHLLPSYALAGTKPRVQVMPGVPMFRTQRALGGRSLAMDTFGKGYDRDGLGRPLPATTGTTIYDFQKVPGMGIAGHRSAYNVLYGDGHAGVFSDPTESLVWHPQGYASNGMATPPNTLATHHVYGNAISGPAGVNTNDPSFKGSALSVWNEVDQGQGIDVP